MLVTVLLLASLINVSISYGQGKNQTAIFAATRWAPVGMAWSGNQLIPATDYAFDGEGVTIWGRDGFPMPDAQFAVSGGYNVRATQSTSVVPLYYTIFYLDCEQTENATKLTEKIFAVIDSAGQLWFDMDGNFNDCRYYGYANPDDPNYINDPASTYDIQSLNPNCYVDPLVGNNTQGPYYILPTKQNGDPQPGYMPSEKVYFRYDKEILEDYIYDPYNRKPPVRTRLMQIAWADMQDYPLIQDTNASADFPIIPSLGTTLKPRQVQQLTPARWDIGLQLIPFANDFDALMEQGEEWHAENVNTENRYTPSEWIYRRTSNIFTNPTVCAGDTRLTDVIVSNSNGQPRTYLAGTQVVDNPPLGVLDPGDDLDVGRPLVQFVYNGTVSSGSELHIENVNSNSLFDPKEYIYRKSGALPAVDVNDFALTNINTNARKSTNPNGAGVCSIGGLFAGDLLIMIEALYSGPTSPTYDLLIQSDTFMGVYPSTAVTSLFDPYGNLLAGSQQISKSASLDSTNALFNYPSTIYHNIKPQFRSYFGLSIFNDNGLDNNFGPGSDTANLNTSSDFFSSKKSEFFLGAQGKLDCPDAGRTLPSASNQQGLYPLTSNYKCVDDGSGAYGCGRIIYKKGGGNTANQVQAGDFRLFPITITRNNIKQTYNIGTTVSPGDLDAGTILANLPANFFFYDVPHGNNQPNGELDPAEDLYIDSNANNIIDYGDIRMSQITIGYYSYPCGDVVDEWGIWAFESQIYGATTGLSGSPTAIDIPVLPGNIGLKSTVYVNNTTAADFRVEQTSNLHVTTTFNLNSGDKVYVTVKNVMTSAKIPWEDTKVITRENPVANFEITPYQGSMFISGRYDPIVVVAFADLKGITTPVPPNGAYQDPYFATKYMPHANIQDSPNLKTLIPPTYPKPTVPISIDGTYDALGYTYHKVRSEGLEIASTRKCLETLEERYPNISLEVYDADNATDVNDPCCIPFAVSKDKTIITLFNVSGGGVKWMATAQGSSGQRYIIQYNNDNTFYFWYWNDIGTIPGAVDGGDYIGNSPNFVPPTPVGAQTPIEVSSQTELVDIDNSSQFATIAFDNDGLFPWGIVTKGDHLGYFDGTSMDVNTGATFGTIVTFGVPIYLTSAGYFSQADYGGWALGMVKPKEAKPIKLRLSTFNICFDYNSTLKTHDQKFFQDTHQGMDYSGNVVLKVLPPDTMLNFSEFQVVDHGLLYSTLDYTAGINSINQLPLPTPQIQHPYNPILRNLQDDFRVYPGGQTHLGRIVRFRGLGRFIHGWNSYPTIWSEWGQRFNPNPRALGKDKEADKALHKVNFNKLGTEFFPITDYAIYFVLKDGFGNHLTFNPGTPVNPTPFKSMVKRIKVSGPFKRPKVMDPITGRVTTDFGFGGMIKLPLVYDFSGELIIDSSNYKFYEFDGDNFMPYIGYGDDKVIIDPADYNQMMLWNNRMDYTGVKNVIKLDEITPTGSGRIDIEVTLMDGTIKKFQDCCADNEYGMKVLGLTISNLPETVGVGQDHTFKPKLTEINDMQIEENCNNAFLYIWQDRGIKFQIEGMDEGFHIGMGDGRTMGTPMPMRDSSRTGGAMFSERQDFNEDGKISFGDWETEIIGTYDFSSNSWSGGMVDGRTYNRNDGMYEFSLTQDANCQITDVGMDIGGVNVSFIRRLITPADHCISENEETSIYITAYKYGDDNNDRGYSPYYWNEWFNVSYTHEVYLAGEAKVNIQPMEELNVEISPQPLTAGVVNELADPTRPLTVRVTDSKGAPVNLLEGVRDLIGDNEVPEDRAWMHLFNDWHPDQVKQYGQDARLPQYYWTRTDLHNSMYDYYSNELRYSDWRDEKTPFHPISIDFKGAPQGIYKFLGFCANDAGEFELTVYTPDRKRMGKAKVRFELPLVEYKVTNMEDPEQKIFTSPGEPDFLLTAAANRIYKITATCKNRQGHLLKQPPKEQRICGEKILTPAHFTPFINVPANWRPRPWFPCNNCDSKYDVHLGIDFNNDGTLQRGNAEIFKFGGEFKTRREYLGWDDQLRAPKICRFNDPVFYNTTNIHYNDNTFSPRPSILLQPDYYPVPTGWGLGCIYNNAYEGTYLFADIEKDQVLNFNDFLALDELGSCTFYVFAEDACNVGGLVGDNPYSAHSNWGDVAGAPMSYYTDPGFFYRRYAYFLDPGFLQGQEMGSRDGTFALDWDAMPANMLRIDPPKLLIKSAESMLPISSNLFSQANFDLSYNLDNHLLVEIHPADDRDLPMPSAGLVMATGAVSGTLSQGSFYKFKDSIHPTTTLYMTPTGQGEGVVLLGYKAKNTMLNKPPYEFTINDSPQYYTIYPITSLDSAPGLRPILLDPKEVISDQKNVLTIQVVDSATGAVVPNANVRVIGDNIDAEGTTGENGKTTIEISPKGIQKLIVKATADKFVSGESAIFTGVDKTPPFISFDQYPILTNKSLFTFKGYTSPGATLTVNGKTIQVTADGTFTARVTLVEGSNFIVVKSELSKGVETTSQIAVTLDTIPPDLMLPNTPELIGKQTYSFTGRVEPGCIVKVNGKEAKVIYDIFEANADVVPGKNTIKVEAIDPAGNIASRDYQVNVYAKGWGRIIIGSREVYNENQEVIGTMQSAATAKLVPVDSLRIIFEAGFTTDTASKTCQLNIFGMSIILESGSTTALVDGKQVTLAEAPALVGGTFMIPPSFVREVLGCDVTVDVLKAEIIFGKIWMP